MLKKQLRDAEKLSSEREKAAQEVQNLRTKIGRNLKLISIRIQEEHGTNLESESELRRLHAAEKKSIKQILKKQKKKSWIPSPETS